MTFEDLGFLYAELELTDEQASAPFAWRATVEFEGPSSGVLRIRVSHDVAAAVAANMLAIKACDDVELVRDAVAEAANVICGNLVPHLGGPEDIFNLGVPTVSSESGSGQEPELAHTAALTLLGVGAGRVEIALGIAGAPAV